jgi:DME family drug/metabolite transporter
VWLAQIALGVFCGAGAWLCFSKGIQHTSALTANFITMIEPVGSAILAFLILNERPTAVALVGCGIVLVTLVFYNLWQAKNTPEGAEA